MLTENTVKHNLNFFFCHLVKNCNLYDAFRVGLEKYELLK